MHIRAKSKTWGQRNCM